MSIRLLPYRQYSDHDVINMFALGSSYVNNNVTGSSYGDAGVFVTQLAADLNADTIKYDSTYDSYLGKTDYPHVGVNEYPHVSLTVKPAASGDTCLGITLLQTAEYDENGEKLLYKKDKREALRCLLPGQAVPIATRGVFAISQDAWDGNVAIGSGLKLSTVSGKVTGCAPSDSARIATVIATGSRTPSTSVADQFAGTGTGKYAIIGLGF